MKQAKRNSLYKVKINRQPPKPDPPMHLERVEAYRDHLAEIGEDVLRAILRSFATIDAITRSNEKLARDFDLAEGAITDGEAKKIATNVMRIEYAWILLRNSDIPSKHQDAFLERYIAQMYPTRDGINTQPPPKISEKQLTDMVAREARHIQKQANSQAKVFGVTESETRRSDTRDK